MTIETLLIALAVGAALVAFWIALRFPKVGPKNFARASAHVAVALAAGWFAPGVVAALAARGLEAAFLAVFGLVFPVLVYTFLASAWFLKLAHDLVARYR